MALTRDFKQTIRARAMRDAAFRRALLAESVEALLHDNLDLGKSLLRDYINATLGFEKLAGLTDKSPKSLMRMFSPNGNPTAKNVFGIIQTLQQAEGIELRISASA